MSAAVPCAAGCCGSTQTEGCTFSPDDRTCIEFACAAGGGNPSGEVPTCTQGAVPPTIGTLTQVWSTNNCPAEFSRILYTGTDGSLTYNAANLAQIQADSNNLLSVYTDTLGYDFTSNTASTRYNPFQEQLIDYCNGSSAQVPGACDLFLSNYCQAKTIDQIQTDPALTALCGCYIDSSNGIGAIDAAGGRACEPLCHLTGVVQQADPTTGTIDRCSGTVCVINDVNISLIGGTTTGTGTLFQQICPSCTAANPCSCIISGVNITNTVAAINPASGGVTYQQACGNNALCYNTSVSGSTATPTTCPAPSSVTTPNASDQVGWPIAFIIVCVFIILAIALIFLMTRHSTRHDAEAAYEGAVAYGESGDAFGPTPEGAKVASDWTYV